MDHFGPQIDTCFFTFLPCFVGPLLHIIAIFLFFVGCCCFFNSNKKFKLIFAVGSNGKDM